MTDERDEKQKTMIHQTKDMTKGNPYSLMLGFALPIFLSQVFQQLYNTADAFIVGSGYRTSSERQNGILAVPVADCGSWEIGYLLRSKIEESPLTRKFLRLFQEELERD